MFLKSLTPSEDWGPLNQSNYLAWRRFKESCQLKRKNRNSSKLKQFLYVLIGRESALD